MSEIDTRITEELKTAMRAKDQTALTVLRALKSALKYAAIEKLGADGVLPETEAIAVVRKQIKQRQDSITQFDQGGRADLAGKERAELALLESFVPVALTDAELGRLVDDAITETGANSKAHLGAVMKLVQTRAAGRADGKTLSQAVMKKLS